MIGDLRYGQHPQRAMPIRSWPTRGRVGTVIVIVVEATTRYAGSGQPVSIKPETRHIVETGEFRELTDFIQIIVISGLLE